MNRIPAAGATGAFVRPADTATSTDNSSGAVDPTALGPVASLSFEAAIDELDGWVHRLESGELGLDGSIAAYRRAAQLAQHCQAKLHAADQEIKKLEGDLLVPVDPSELRGGGG